MPSPQSTNRLEVAALQSLFDDSVIPPLLPGMLYVVNLVNEVYPDYLASVRDAAYDVESKIWTRNRYRVPNAHFGRPGDILLWMPCEAFPAGNASIHVRGAQCVVSSPHFTFTPVGRLLVHNVAISRAPDIVVRIG